MNPQENILHLSRQMVMAVRRLDELDRDRSLALGEVARGEADMDARGREAMAQLNREMSELLGRVSPHTRRVIRTNELGVDAGAMPKRFMELYALLCYSAYGMDRGPGSADAAEVGKAAGVGETWRVDSSKTTTRPGGAKPAKKYGSGRILVKNERSFKYKRNIDQKLRRLGMDLEKFLAGESGSGSGVAGQRELRYCSVCGRYAEHDWAYCPRDGGKVVVESC